MTTQAVLEGLESQYARLNAAIDGLGAAAETAWVTEEGGWTAKDVVAHLIHFDGQIPFGLGATGGGPPAYVLGVTERLTGEEWSARAVAYWSEFPLEVLRAELDSIVESILEQVRRRDDEEINAVGTIDWYPPDRPLWAFIGNDTFLAEWPAHAEQMEQAAARLRAPAVGE